MYQIGIDRLLVDRRSNRHSEQGLDFRGEVNGVANSGPIERNLTQAIAAHNQALVFEVIERQCPHSIKARKTVHGPSLICLDDHFRVRSRTKMMSAVYEVIAQLHMIKELSIEGDTADPARVHKRLMPSRCQINNREASMGEANIEGNVIVRIT